MKKDYFTQTLEDMISITEAYKDDIVTKEEREEAFSLNLIIAGLMITKCVGVYDIIAKTLLYVMTLKQVGLIVNTPKSKLISGGIFSNNGDEFIINKNNERIK